MKNLWENGENRRESTPLRIRVENQIFPIPSDFLKGKRVVENGLSTQKNLVETTCPQAVENYLADYGKAAQNSLFTGIARPKPVMLWRYYHERIN